MIVSGVVIYSVFCVWDHYMNHKAYTKMLTKEDNISLRANINHLRFRNVLFMCAYALVPVAVITIQDQIQHVAFHLYL